MVVDKDPEILFQSLVCALRLAICLGVIGRADVLGNSQRTTKFPRKHGGETGVTIGNDVAW